MAIFVWTPDGVMFVAVIGAIMLFGMAIGTLWVCCKISDWWNKGKK